MIGQYLDQLDELAEHLDAPVIKGDTTVKERERLYEAFRTGELDLLVVSKVANFSVDLPEAAVAIQVSGQLRLPPGGGAAPRPAAAAQGEGADGTQKPARFYTIVSRDTVDADFAQNRQRFLAEQGYAYRIVDAADL